MRLKPNKKKVMWSLIVAAIAVAILFALTFFDIERTIVELVLVFILVAVIVYFTLCLIQPEYDEDEE